MLCKYKDALGIPNKGIHKYRIFNIAIVDVLLTILLAAFISWYFKLSFYKFLIVLLLLFLTGIFMHRLFCVKTTIDKLLF
jgi:hypothetical protein